MSVSEGLIEVAAAIAVGGGLALALVPPGEIMYTPVTGYGHYRFRLNGVEVQAAQMTIYNLKRVSEWIRVNGGATTGMLVRDQGEIARRGIWLGTITGSIVGGGEHDWMIHSPSGFSVCPAERFALMYELVNSRVGLVSDLV